MDEKHRSLRADYANADVETKNTIIALMDQKNEALREKFLAGDASVIKITDALAVKFSSEVDSLSNEIDSLSNDLDSAVHSIEKDMGDMENDLQDDITNAVDDLEAKDMALEAEFEDKLSQLEDKFETELRHSKQLEDLEHDMLADELADLKTELSGQPDEIHQHVNIEIDLGEAMKSNEGFFAEGLLNLEWWHYLLIGLGFLVVMVAGCIFKP